MHEIFGRHRDQILDVQPHHQRTKRTIIDIRNQAPEFFPSSVVPYFSPSGRHPIKILMGLINVEEDDSVA
jgi:hypothetical protein